MALNKSMHPRNRYKDKPPDFAYLASKYEEFQKHVYTDLTGRVMVNFKQPEAVRALTCTLLKEDFGLAIEIPLERLIPTVPLRLNYIHWVEDLIQGTDQGQDQGQGQGTPRMGIDIGTGASCIYPLLGASMNGWYFLATEVDDMCFDFATRNVQQNNLHDLIKVVKVPHKTLLMDALKEETTIVYDFCMCNPPFFANQLEAKGENSRNSRRPPPSSVNTGGVTEIMAEGGELEFVKRIIHDSLQLKTRLRWYSCMLGKKCSLAPLKEELRKHGVPHVTHTEFCQGRTMRWALAWSFYDHVVLPSPPSKKRKVEKFTPRKPLSFTVLQPKVRQLQATASSLGCGAHSSAVEAVTFLLERTLTDSRVLHKRVPRVKDEQSLFLTAVENTWIHRRKKHRDLGRQLRELPRAPPGAGGGHNPATAAPATTSKTSQPQKQQPPSSSQSIDRLRIIFKKEPTATQQPAREPQSPSPDLESNRTQPRPQGTRVQDDVQRPGEDACSVPREDTGESESVTVESPTAAPPQTQTQAAAALHTEQEVQTAPQEVPAEPEEETKVKQEVAPAERRPESPFAVQHFLFKSLVNVRAEERDVSVEMHWVEGQNKELMNQLLTYLKNELLRTVASGNAAQHLRHASGNAAQHLRHARSAVPS